VSVAAVVFPAQVVYPAFRLRSLPSQKQSLVAFAFAIAAVVSAVASVAVLAVVSAEVSVAVSARLGRVEVSVEVSAGGFGLRFLRFPRQERQSLRCPRQERQSLRCPHQEQQSLLERAEVSAGPSADVASFEAHRPPLGV
jgi:hypothetical protein